MKATQKDTTAFRIYPGRGYLDLNADDTVRDDYALRIAEHVRTDRFIAERRQGSRKIHVFTAPNGALTFASVANYAAFTPPLIPKGGFWVRLSFTAVRPSSGSGYLVSSVVNGKAYGPLTISLDSTGVLTAAFRDEAAETEYSVASSAITANAPTHLLLVFDPVNGTWSMYLNGELEDADTGIDAATLPMQDGPAFYFAVNTDGAGSPVAASNFDGKLDAWCLGALRGTDVSGGSPTLLAELRKWTFAEWRNPASRMVLSCMDMNDVSGTTILDRSRYLGHATITGSPTADAGVAWSALPGNFAGRLQLGGGRMDNVVIAGGALYYETLREAAS